MEAKNLARDFAANGENPTLSSKVQDRSTDVWGQEKMHAVEKPGLEPFLCTLLFWGMACMAWLPVRWDRPWGSEPGTRCTYPNGTSTWITHWETFAKSKYSLQNRMKSLKVMASGGGGNNSQLLQLKEKLGAGDTEGLCWQMVYSVPAAGEQGLDAFSGTGPLVAERLSNIRESEIQSHRNWSGWQETKMNIQV